MYTYLATKQLYARTQEIATHTNEKMCSVLTPMKDVFRNHTQLIELCYNALMLPTVFQLPLLGVLLTNAVTAEVYVPCEYQQRVCECPPSHQTCYFYLRVESIRTFTSYQLVQDKERRLVRGRGASPVAYHFNGLGTLVPDSDLRNGCVTYSEGFSQLNCTEPITLDSRNGSYESVVVLNGITPGPTLIVSAGQTIMVEVLNDLGVEVTSIHWHGLTQNGTPWMDGVPGVSQCPITPGSTYVYTFSASSAGTFWYHSHTGDQRTKGAYGALIIRENPDYMSEAMARIGDFIGAQNVTLIDSPSEHTALLLEWSFDGGRGKSGLINGRGVSTETPPNSTRLMVFHIELGNEGKRYYRFRLLGAQSESLFRFSISEHKLTVIGTDGYFVEPIKNVDYVFIHTGERYDFLLEPTTPAVAKKTQNFLVLAEDVPNNEASIVAKSSFSAMGVLRYGKGHPSSAEYEHLLKAAPRNCTAQNRCVALNCPFKSYYSGKHTDCIPVTQLRLLFPTPAGEIPTDPASDVIFFDFAPNGENNSPSINGRNFVFPSGSLLTQPEQPLEKCALGRTNCLASQECVCTHVHELNNTDQTVQLVLSALDNRHDGGEHSVHLHGHSFHVVSIAYGQYDAEGNLKGPTTDITCDSRDARCTAPMWTSAPPPAAISAWTVRKDTIVVPAGGYAIIRFRSSNPGWWLMHCHMDPDFAGGMAVAFNELGFNHPRPPPPLDQLKCGSYKPSPVNLLQDLYLGAGADQWALKGKSREPQNSRPTCKLQRIGFYYLVSCLVPI